MGDMRCVRLIDNGLMAEAIPIKPEIRTRMAKI